jgi:hypothetical protein
MPSGEFTLINRQKPEPIVRVSSISQVLSPKQESPSIIDPAIVD